MTTPNNQPPSPAPAYGITGSGSAADGSGTTAADLATRTQSAIQALLAQQVQSSANWQGSSTSVFQGIAGGLPGLIISFFQNLLGIAETDMRALLTEVEQLPGIKAILADVTVLLQLLGLGGGTGNTSSGGNAAGAFTWDTFLSMLGSTQQVTSANLQALAPAAAPNALSDPNLSSGAFVQGQDTWVWDGWFGPDDPHKINSSIRTIRTGLITVYVAPGTPGGLFASGFDQGTFLKYMQDPSTEYLANGFLFDQLDPAHFEVVFVPYPSTGTPTVGVQQGISWMTNQINSLAGPFILVGNGQGTLIMSGVYDQIRYGSLQNRRNDLLAGVMFGNMRREEGRGFPGYTPPVGTSGVVVDCAVLGPYTSQGDPTNPAGGNLVDTEDLWWEMAAAGDYLSCCPVTGTVVNAGVPAWFNSPRTGMAMLESDTAVIDEMVKLGMAADGQATGVTIGISGPMGDYYQSYGSGTAVGNYFFWGSCSKGVTATAILIAVGNGLLTLDDTLSQYVSGVPNGDQITIREMLMQTSGVYDTEQDEGLNILYLLNPELEISQAELLKIIKEGGANALPGVVWYYTASNFILLGLILEAVYPGQTAAEILTNTVIEPGGLTAQFMSGPEPLPSPADTGYVPLLIDLLGLSSGVQPQGITNMDYYWTAGAVAGTIHGLVKFGTISGQGALLNPTVQQTRMETFTSPTETPMEPWSGPTGAATYQEWGLGWYQIGSWIGNDGSVPGFDCATMYEPVTQTTIAVMENYQTTSPYVLAALALHWYNIASYLVPGSVDQPGYSRGGSAQQLISLDTGNIQGYAYRSFWHAAMQKYAGNLSTVVTAAKSASTATAGQLNQCLTLQNYYMQNTQTPQNSYYFGQPRIAQGDSRSYVQIALDYINSFAGGSHPDGTEIVAPPVDGVRHQVLGQRFAVKPGQELIVGVQTMYTNVQGSGDQIMLAVNVYDVDNNLMATIAGSDVAPDATVSNPDPTTGWRFATLQDDWVMPANAAQACIVFDVEPEAMQLGTVWFGKPVFEISSTIAGWAVDQTTLNQIAGEQVSGPQGQADMATALLNMVNNLANAATGNNMDGVAWAESIQALAQSVANSQTALTLGVSNNQVLTAATQPMYVAMTKSAQATFPWTSLTPGSSLNTINVPAGTSVIGHINCNQAIPIGVIKFVAQAPTGGATNVYVNVYTLDPVNGYTNVYASGDVSGFLPAGAQGRIAVNLPGADEPTVQIAQWVAIEVVNAGSNPIGIVGETWAMPNEPGATPTNLAAERSLSGTGGNSPTTLLPSQLTYGGNVPWLVFDVSNLPPTYEPPDSWKRTSAGMYKYPIPSWVSDGDLLDLVISGAGGTGGDADGTVFLGQYLSGGNGQGGTGGTWAALTAKYGTDIVPGTTELDVIVGAGPDAPSSDGGMTLVGYGFINPPQFVAWAAPFSNYGTALTTALNAPTNATDLYVLVAVNTGWGTFQVTYGDVPMIPKGLVYNGGSGTGGATALFELFNAPAGDQSINVQFAKACYATVEAVAFTDVSASGLVSTASGKSAALAHEVECDANQVIVQAFGALNTQMSAFQGGTNGPYDFTQVGAAFHQGLTLSWANQTTTFEAANNVPGVWGSIAIVLYPTGTVLLSTKGGAGGGPGGASNFNPANTNNTATGKGPGNDTFQNIPYIGGPDATTGALVAGNVPGGGSPGGNSNHAAPGPAADGAAFITSRQGAYVAGPAVQQPIPTEFATPGTFTYDVPAGAIALDFIILGAGASGLPGNTSTLVTGWGGLAGQWLTATVSPASGWPSNGQVTVVVGAGGAEQGINGATTVHPGAASSVSAPGMPTYSAPGGNGPNTGSVDGQSPGNQSYNGENYIGGAEQLPDYDGNAPGAGGGGGDATAAQYYYGGAGGPGAVWIVARFS